ncbi:MAG: hypothetical protein RPR28_07775 [Cycloclasticus sp.]
MILYDSDPRRSHRVPIAKFKGDKTLVDDPVVYAKFSEAKKNARERITKQMTELQKQLDMLRGTTLNNCPIIINPFTNHY